MIHQEKEFQELWLNKLSEEQKITRIKKAFGVIRKVAQKQIELLRLYRKAPIEKKFWVYVST